MRSLGAMVLTGVEKSFSYFYKDIISNAIQAGALKSDRNLEVAFVSTNKRWDVIRKIRQQQDTDNQAHSVIFPFMMLRVETKRIAPMESGKNFKALHRQGVPIEIKDNSENAYVTIRPIPVLYDFVLTYLTDDFWEANVFSDAWLLSSADKKDLNFNLNYYGYTFTIQVEPDTTIAFPEKEDSIDIPNFYELTANFKVLGYTAKNVHESNLPMQQTLRQINVSANISGYDENGDELFNNLDEEKTKIFKPYT